MSVLWLPFAVNTSLFRLNIQTAKYQQIPILDHQATVETSIGLHNGNHGINHHSKHPHWSQEILKLWSERWQRAVMEMWLVQQWLKQSGVRRQSISQLLRDFGRDSEVLQHSDRRSARRYRLVMVSNTSSACNFFGVSFFVAVIFLHLNFLNACVGKPRKSFYASRIWSLYRSPWRARRTLDEGQESNQFTVIETFRCWLSFTPTKLLVVLCRLGALNPIWQVDAGSCRECRDPNSRVECQISFSATLSYSVRAWRSTDRNWQILSFWHSEDVT